MSKDYYGLLGVSRSSTNEEIKKAYRKLAKEKHPDRNPGDVKAESDFKAIQEAYEVLSDPHKKAIYDGGGTSYRRRSSPPPPQGFSFHEVVEEFFGGSTYKGRNIQARLEIDFKESFTGCKKTIKVKKKKRCNTCSGHGHTGFQPCAHCSGQGFVKSSDAPFEIRTGCQVCGGTGKISLVKCGDCLGVGQLPGFQEKPIEINIPAGIDNGMQIRIEGEGEESLRTGGKVGDLVVFVLVKEHPIFVRNNFNLTVDIPVSYTQLVLGSEIEVPTLLNENLIVKIPKGSQSHTKFRIKGKGFSFGRNVGDLIVTVKLEVPKTIDETYQKNLEQLKELEVNNVTPHREQWAKKVAANK